MSDEPFNWEADAMASYALAIQVMRNKILKERYGEGAFDAAAQNGSEKPD